MAAVILVLALLLLFLVGLFFAARWLARRWLKLRPTSDLAGVITPTGFALNGCFVLVLIVGKAAREIEPNGPLGAFLNQPGGQIAGVLIAVIGYNVAAAALSRLGHPIMRRKHGGDV